MSQPVPTQLKLQPPTHDGERILVYGAESVGKTHGWFRIGEVGDGRIFALDTDRSVARFLSSPRWAHMRDRVEYHTPASWPEYIKPVAKWTTMAEGNDWLVIDLYGKAWSTVQAYFTEEVFGQAFDDYVLGYRKHLAKVAGKGSKNPFDATVDWSVIKSMYARLTNAILQWPGHVYLAAGQKSINEQFDSPALQERYRPVGSKPDTDKDAGHLVHTILYLAPNRRMTSLKDRERKLLDGQKVDDMALGYLCGIAGWRPIA